MSCNCMIPIKNNYDIEIIQGDYASFDFILTDQNDVALSNVKSVIFTCKRLATQIELTKIDDTQYGLLIDGNTTQAFEAGNYSYDITVKFKNNQFKTAIYDGVLTILKKENVVNESS